MYGLANRSVYIALTSVLIIVAPIGPAHADSGMGWFSCEAGQTTPTKYVLSSIFSFEYNYPSSQAKDVPEKSAAEMSTDELADQIWSDINDHSARSEKFGPQAQAALAARFQERVKSELGISCLTAPQALGPYDTRDEAEMQQDILEGIYVDIRSKFDGIELELVKIPFTP